MTLESNKNLGGIGAILMALGALPFLGYYTGIVSLIGLVLVLIAIKGLSDYYKDASIFNNALYGVITAIVGGVIFITVIISAAIGLLNSLGISNWSDWSALQKINWASIVNIDVIWPYVTAILLGLVLLFVFAIVTAIFLRRSLSTLADKTKVGMFGTTGLMLLIGAVLTIIIIGFVLLWVALILLAVAFFTIPLQPTQPAATAAP
jgi:uncharacterized membrane protein